MNSALRRIVGAVGIAAASLSFIACLPGCPQKKPPAADFVATPQTGEAPLQVQFTDRSSAGSAAIEQWYWEFGDGAVSMNKDPVHLYFDAGQYTVSLKVTSKGGSDFEMKTGYITVESPAEGEAAITVKTVEASAGSQVMVPVSLTATGAMPAAFVFQVNYGADRMQFVEARGAAAAAKAGKTVRAYEPSPGMIRIALYGDTQAVADGTIAELVFKLTNARPGERLPLDAKDASAADGDARRRAVSTVSGSVVVQ